MYKENFVQPFAIPGKGKRWPHISCEHLLKFPSYRYLRKDVLLFL